MKKLFSLLLFGVLFAVVLSGCNGNAEIESDSSVTNSPNSSKSGDNAKRIAELKEEIAEEEARIEKEKVELLSIEKYKAEQYAQKDPEDIFTAESLYIDRAKYYAQLQTDVAQLPKLFNSDGYTCNANFMEGYDDGVVFDNAEATKDYSEMTEQQKNNMGAYSQMERYLFQDWLPGWNMTKGTHWEVAGMYPRYMDNGKDLYCMYTIWVCKDADGNIIGANTCGIHDWEMYYFDVDGFYLCGRPEFSASNALYLGYKKVPIRANRDYQWECLGQT